MTIPTTANPIVLVLSVLLVLGLATAAQAEAATAQVAQAQAPQGQSVSDATLRAYALAIIEVNRIHTAFQPRISGAENPDQAQQLRREATNLMIEAVKEKGLSVEQYNRVNAMAQQDPALQAAISEHMKDARAKAK